MNPLKQYSTNSLSFFSLERNKVSPVYKNIVVEKTERKYFYASYYTCKTNIFEYFEV